MASRAIGTLAARPADPGELVVDEVMFRIDTETGSRYELNFSRGMWRRVHRTERSGELRAEGGELLIVGKVLVGYSLTLLYMPFDGDAARYLVTSPVVRLSVALGAGERPLSN